MPRVLVRWTAFNLVGAAGIAVQLATLAALVRLLHVPVLAATAIAVETAVLHNFAWHQRWTWKDRPVQSVRDTLSRLARFHALNGGVSLGGNLLLVWLLTRAFHIDPVAASAVAIACCALVNFAASEWLVFRTTAVVLPFVLLGTPSPAAAGPSGPTIAAWDQYVATVEARFRDAPESGGSFFTRDWKRNTSGVSTHRTDAPSVPDGRIHHWAGAIFVPGVTLAQVLDRLRQGAGHESEHYSDVLASRLLRADGDHLAVFLKLRRSAIITVTYNTEHDIQYRRLGARRATQRAIATRIAELDGAGTPREREKGPGDDNGFLWRLNAYWRYEEMDGGVLIECESVSLSRNAPFGLRTVIGPIIEKIARESLEATLAAVRVVLSAKRP